MTVRKILQANDQRGESILRRKSSKVRQFDDSLERLVRDMFETLHSYHGVGLAAPQIGVLQRVVIAELPAPEPEEKGPDAPGEDAGPATGERPHGEQFVLCNPEITWRSEDLQVGEEGCLSLLGWYAQVPRAQSVEIRYQDLQGHRRKILAEGYLARILQHECDHLEGALFSDRIEDLATLVRITEDGEEEPVPMAEVAVVRRGQQ